MRGCAGDHQLKLVAGAGRLKPTGCGAIGNRGATKERGLRLQGLKSVATDVGPPGRRKREGMSDSEKGATAMASDSEVRRYRCYGSESDDARSRAGDHAVAVWRPP